jgi:hypothetical protein
MDPRPDALSPRDSFRRLTFYSLLGGLCPLIPVPFMDDWALGQVQRRMVWELGRREGISLSPQEAKILAGGDEPGWQGCLGTVAWAVREVTGTILGKLFRTVFYFLTIRRSVRRSAETLHLGYLVHHAFRLGPAVFPPSARTGEPVRAVRAAALATMKEVDATPIHRTLFRDFRRSLSLLLQAASVLRRFLPRRRKRKTAELPEESFKKEEELLGGLTDRLAADLWGNREYFAGLERVFEAKLSPR